MKTIHNTHYSFDVAIMRN